MTVEYLEVEQLANIEGLYSAILARFDLRDAMGVPDHGTMALALVSAHHANVLALHLTYEDACADLDPHARFNLDPEHVKIVWAVSDDMMRGFVQNVCHVRWNCVTNSGTHCLPPRYEQVLNGAEKIVLRILARVGRFADRE